MDEFIDLWMRTYIYAHIVQYVYLDDVHAGVSHHHVHVAAHGWREVAVVHLPGRQIGLERHTHRHIDRYSYLDVGLYACMYIYA
jgi:hypothetical protein